jgi:uncharacterized protein
VVLYQRGIATNLLAALSAVPVVVLEGGRAVGKSTLCRMLTAENGWPEFIDLSDPGVSEALRLDPVRFLRALPNPAIIDEAQVVPELTLWIKRVVDERNGQPGQFLLTGSARLGRHQLGGGDPLAGRSIRLRMWSLTPSERANMPRALAADLFNNEYDTGTTLCEEWHPADWLRGGLPGLPGVFTSGDTPTWDRAVSAYIESVIPLGVESSRVDQSRVLRAFRYFAANTGQHVNFARAATELSMKADTVQQYVTVLENSFLLYRTEAHRPTEHKVLTAHPRLFTTDVGLASWASRIIDRAPSASLLGSLLENQVSHALAATTDWSPERISLRHWRDQRAKREVDLLLVHPDGRTVPIEVKASTVVAPSDTEGLIAFASANPTSFFRGYVAYCGRRTVDLSPTNMAQGSILAVPIERLLRPSP